MGYNRQIGDSKRKKKKVKHSGKGHKHTYNNDVDAWDEYTKNNKHKPERW